MKTARLKINLPLLVLCVTAMSAAHATAPDIYHSKGLVAGAYYSSVDVSGCVNTYAFVEVGLEATGTAPKPGQQPALAYMYVITYDQCSGAYSNAVTNSPVLLPVGAVQFAPSLKSASLNATIPLVDDSGNTHIADVNITWAATGTVERQTYHDHYKAQAGIYEAYDRGLTQDCAVTGSIVVDGANVTLPTGWGQAWIGQDVEGYVRVLKLH